MGRSRAGDAGKDKIAALKRHVADRAADFEVIAQRRDADAPLALRALEIVRAFIVERGLVLYGGQAIDFALRAAPGATGIYPEHQIPDYDFFSPRSVDDAYDLAEILEKEGFPNVSAVPAVHIQTMRVAVNFIFVADISYTPTQVFDRLKTLTFKGMKILHPDHQRADMHLAFCFPFSNPPREDIFHRYSKDLKRFRLFQEAYPIKSDCGAAASGAAASGAAANNIFSYQMSDTATPFAIHGAAAYALIRRDLDALLAAAGRDDSALEGIPAPGLTITRSSSTLEFRLQSPLPLAFATPDPEAFLEASGAENTAEAIWHAPYMDIRPRAAIAPGGVEVHSTRNRLLAVSRARYECGAASGAASDAMNRQTFLVASPQYVLLGFLFRMISEDAESPVARSARDHYLGLLRMLEVGGEALVAIWRKKHAGAVSGSTDCASGSTDCAADPEFRKLVSSSPFGFPLETLGTENKSAAYLVNLSRTAQQAGDTPPRALASPEDLPDLKNTPERFFPARGGPRPKFDYESNAAFQRYGQVVEAPAKDLKTGSGPDTAMAAPESRGADPRLARTYMVPGAPEPVIDSLIRLLREDGWSQAPPSRDSGKTAGFVALSGAAAWDRSLWSVEAGIKNRLQQPSITNKLLLHELLREGGEGDLVPESFIDDFESDPKAAEERLDGEVWIWRPEDGFAGKGVALVATPDDLAKARSGVRTSRASRKARPGARRALLSRYIADPLLIPAPGGSRAHEDLRKFHLRLYFLTAVLPEGSAEFGGRPGRRSAVFEEGLVIYADKPYERPSGASTEAARRGRDDRDVHDTHLHGKEGLRFPRDYPPGPAAAEKVIEDARDALTRVSRLTLGAGLVQPYEEALGGYELLGVDAMIDSSGRFYLIEINHKPGVRAAEVGAADAELEFLAKGIRDFVFGDDPFATEGVRVCFGDE